jgi:hypothetical protein
VRDLFKDPQAVQNYFVNDLGVLTEDQAVALLNATFNISQVEFSLIPLLESLFITNCLLEEGFYK